MKEETLHKIEGAVFDVYLETGQGLTIPEVSTLVHFGETTVREAVRSSERLELGQKMARITRHDGAFHQFRTVDAYIPTRRWLREELVKLRPLSLHQGGRGWRRV
jgi:hypothetical protein